MMNTRARSDVLWPSVTLVLGLLIVGLLPLDPVFRFTLIIAIAWAIAAIGLDLLVGYTGQLSFGHVGFVALGAYSVTVLRREWELPLILALLGGLLIAGTTAYLLGAAMVRLKLFGFAIVTFFFGHLVATVLRGYQLSDLTGGPNGLAVPSAEIQGVSLSFGIGLYLLAILCLLLTVVVVANLVSSRTGRALRLLKSNEAVAASCGIPVNRLKSLSFVISCMLAALGGFVYALAVGFLSPESFLPIESAYLFAMIVIGGLGSVAGPIVGALLLTLTPEYVFHGDHVSVVIFAAAMTVCLIVLPDGVVGLVVRGWQRITRRAPVLNDEHDQAEQSVWEPSVPSDADAKDRGIVSDARPVLVVDGLNVHFDEFAALSDVSLSVSGGTSHAIIGPNGAGKTTLLNVISGLQVAQSDVFEILGEQVDGRNPVARRRAGVVRAFQHPTLAPDLSVIENVKVGLFADRPQSLYRDLLGSVATKRAEAELEERARWALDMVGISASRIKVEVPSLSLSEQKRVEIARAIVGEARLLLLDEPTAGLSADEMDGVRSLLEHLRTRLDLSLVLVSHHIGFLRRVAHEMTVLDYGRVIAYGPTDEVLSRPDVARTFAGIADAHSDTAEREL